MARAKSADRAKTANKLYFIGIVICLFILLVLVGFLFARTPNTNHEDMIAKYGRETFSNVCYGEGTCLHIQEQGNKQAPTLILVHGSTASMHLWDKLTPHLTENYHIITLDLPAHGLSQPHILDDYTPAAMVEAIDAVANHFNVQKFTYIGSSMGARMGWHYALAHQDKLNALIMSNPSGAEHIENDQNGTKAKIGLGVRFMQMPIMRPIVETITPRSLFKNQLKDMIVDDNLVTDIMIDRYWELLRLPGNRRAAALRATTNQTPEKITHINKITVPTLIIWGEQDAVLPVAQSAYFHENITDSTLIIYENAAHLPMEEVPLKFANDIKGFLTP